MAIDIEHCEVSRRLLGRYWDEDRVLGSRGRERYIFFKNFLCVITFPITIIKLRASLFYYDDVVTRTSIFFNIVECYRLLVVLVAGERYEL